MSSDTTKNCHGCQALLSMDEKKCPYCHQAQQTAAEVHIARFFAGLFPKRQPVTQTIFVVLIIYYILIAIDILQSSSYGMQEVLLNPPGEIIYRWGAHLRGEFTWWRFVTANFVHIGILHIVFNLYALRYVVPYIERSYGSPLTLAAFVFLGTGSMLCSNLLGSSGIVAGASGALMAFIGMAAVAAHKEKTTLSIELRNGMLKWAGITIVFGLVVSASGTMGIDNIAHISGFLLGALTAAVLPAQTTTGYSSLAQIRLSRFACFAALLFTAFAFANLGNDGQFQKYENECISKLKINAFEQAEPICEDAYKTDRSQMISYHNYIYVLRINGKYEKAREICTEGIQKFQSSGEPVSFRGICESIPQK